MDKQVPDEDDYSLKEEASWLEAGSDAFRGNRDPKWIPGAVVAAYNAVERLGHKAREELELERLHQFLFEMAIAVRDADSAVNISFPKGRGAPRKNEGYFLKEELQACRLVLEQTAAGIKKESALQAAREKTGLSRTKICEALRYVGGFRDLEAFEEVHHWREERLRQGLP